MDEKSIVFVIPWFGKMPEWMPFFMASCEKNADVHFFLHTDSEYDHKIPANVSINNLSYKEYSQKIEDALKIKFIPNNPYKLCDLKPALGHIHEKEIAPFEFWGFCDIDVIFGRIRKYITKDVLNNYDMFTSFDRRISGHFTILKNNEEFRMKYRTRRDWSSIFQDQSNNYAFDEKSFSRLFFGFKNMPKPIRKVLTHVFLKDSTKILAVNTFPNVYGHYPAKHGDKKFPSAWHWNNGILKDITYGDEYLYIHFCEWKKYWKTNGMRNCVSSDEIFSAWVINRHGFESKM